MNKTMMKRDFILIFMLLWAALLLAACGGQAVKANDGRESVQLTIAGTDALQFTPDQVSIGAESDVTLDFTNAGQLDHNFMLIAGDFDPFAIKETDALAGINTGIIPGGEEATLNFSTPSPGTYTFLCVVPGHAAAGMTGTFTVTEP